jgi:GT2 family glycosyltransferase
LERALDSLEHQSIGDDAFEVIVVDNSSSDDTRSVVEAAVGRVPGLRYVRHDVIGLSAARNRAIEEARGEVYAILDDDAVASPTWLEVMAAAFERHARAGAIGGRIELIWPGPAPAWISEETAPLYARFDGGPVEREFRFPHMPFGTNLGLRADIVEKVGGFSTELGRVGGSLISGEEAELCFRIATAGYLVMYEPDLQVGHHVLPERVSRRWLLFRSFEQGRTRAIAQAVRRERTTRAAWLRLMLTSAAQTLFAGPPSLLLKILTLQARGADVMDAAVRSTMTFACAVEAGRYLVDPRGRRYAPET